MTRVDRVRFTECESIPWANGGGSTRTLVDDSVGRGGEWSYRISVADLSGSQPFSRFDGVDRHLTFLGPGKLAMHVNGRGTVLAARETTRFRGEDAVWSEPSAAGARDLNVMTRRHVRRATAKLIDGRSVLTPDPDADVSFWISLSTGGTADGELLEELDLVRLHPDRRLHADGSGLFVESWLVPTSEDHAHGSGSLKSD